MATKFMPAGEQLAKLLELTNGTITGVPNGRLIRISDSANNWDVAREWTGREITSWKARNTTWGNCVVVSFYVHLSSSAVPLPIFTLSLTKPVSEEDVSRAADTYMMLLNLTRRE